MIGKFKFKLPFGFWPGHWGLKGKIREEAKICYEEDDPEKRDILLAKLNFGDNEELLNLRLLEIEKKYNHINEFDYEIKKNEIIFKYDQGTEEEKTKRFLLRKLEILKKYNNIEKHEYEKELSNLNNKPYINITSENFEIDEETGATRIGLNFDWNDIFIENLKKSGYKGLSEEEIVEQWFNDIIISNLNEDDFEKLALIRKEKQKNKNLSENKRPTSIGRSSLKILKDDNTTEYR